MTIIYTFFLCGFLGWMAELGLKSFESKHIALEQMHWRLPFLPIYGFGAIYMLMIRPMTGDFPLLVKGLLFAFALTAVEYLGGIASELIFKKNFWNYSNVAYNIHGMVDLEHFIYWFGLGLMFDQIIYPISIKALAIPA